MRYINYPLDRKLLVELSGDYNDTKKEQYLLFEVPTSGIFNVVAPRGTVATPVYSEQTIVSGSGIDQFVKWFFYVGTGITETGELQNPKLVHYVNLEAMYGSNRSCAIPISFPVKKGDFIKIINPASTMCRNGTINTQFAISSTPITIDITNTYFSGLHVFITPNSGSSIKTGNKVFPRKGSLAKPTMVPSYKNSEILEVMKLKTLKQADESEEIEHTFTASSDGWYFITPADRYEGSLTGNTPSTANTDIKIYINDILVEENYPWTSPISGSRPAVEQPSTKYTVWEVSCQIEQTSCVFVRKGEVIKTTIDRSLPGFVNRSEDKIWWYMMALTYERIFVPVLVE